MAGKILLLFTMFNNLKSPHLLVCVLCLTAFRLVAQPHTRSGLEQTASHVATSTNSLPCAGTIVFQEDFESGSSNWTSLDVDGLTPNPNTGLSAGWQERVDYYDSTNTVMVSQSWYTTPGTSDDWLISPSVTLGSNPCLSWSAYSKDLYYKEAYEVRISTTTPDTAGFFAQPVLLTIEEESESPTTRSLSLAGYAGQTVFIAFRQVSTDKFILALDDVIISNVNNIDIGVTALRVPVSNPGDTLDFEFLVANYGSDTIRSFLLSYSIEGAAADTMQFAGISLAPNEVDTFAHNKPFLSDSVEAFYDFCAWTSLPDGLTDEDLSNDTLCGRFAVGTPVYLEEFSTPDFEWVVYPNPTAGEVQVVLEGKPGKHHAMVSLLDLQGRTVWLRELHFVGRIQTEMPQQLPGIYLVKVVMGQQQVCRLLRFD
jgi:hypothetical protein